MGLCSHMLISCKFCYYWFIKFMSPSLAPVHLTCIIPRMFFPCLITIGYVLLQCSTHFPIDSPSPWPPSYACCTLSLLDPAPGIRPFLPVFSPMLSILPLCLSLVCIGGCNVCACADGKQHSDFQTGPCLVSLIVSNS